MDLVLLGPPGAGKGTQAQLLQKHYGYRQISTGDILRANRRQGTQLGKAAEGYMLRGELVPDELILRMVESELRADERALFDGFPRTVAQAEALDAMLLERGREMPAAIAFKIDRATLEERLLGRWTNPRNGRVYNERFNPPRQPRIDDEDGGPLVQREDDKPETVARRLDVFERETLPLVAYYQRGRAGRLISIDAAQPVDRVAAQIRSALHLEENAPA